MTQLWGGRFGSKNNTDSCLAELNCSLNVDARLYADDLDGSKAYAEALQRAGYLTESECEAITKTLEIVRIEWAEGQIKFLPSDEDVHTVNERRLIELVGEVGQRLHTGRSRNDQIITDMKLWLRKGIRDLCKSLRQTFDAVIKQSEKHLGVLMPGYTHLQRAQPVQFSHWLLSHAFALKEDCMRLLELRERANVLPLGSGALAGNPLGIDRVWLAKRLGFRDVTSNSMHAVGDRDFVVDFIYCCSMISLHLSRLAEDLILYASKEFDFVRISNEFSTGSSLMPQKRNPDSLELVRGISGVVCSSLTGIMFTLKGTPTTYNKDLQFDKEYCFNAFDKVQQALMVTRGVIATLSINTPQMESALSPDMLATDWAYYLVRKGVPFRSAHEYIGKIVVRAEEMSLELTEIPLEELQNICPKFDADVANASDYGVNVEKYDAVGGTATKSVKNQIEKLKQYSKQIMKFE